MAIANFSYEDFTRYVKNVSRETFLTFQKYMELLEKWQKTINLVGAGTLGEGWIRHIIDSAQLYPYIDASDTVVDMGSGAGFPGLVLAIMGNKNITLVESDARKTVFLQEAARVTDTRVFLRHDRVENIELNQFSLITARGFASLASLLDLIGSRLKETHKMLLPKGKKYKEELHQAGLKWSFEHTIYPSVTDPEAAIIFLHHLKRREAL